MEPSQAIRASTSSQVGSTSLGDDYMKSEANRRLQEISLLCGTIINLRPGTYVDVRSDPSPSYDLRDSAFAEPSSLEKPFSFETKELVDITEKWQKNKHAKSNRDAVVSGMDRVYQLVMNHLDFLKGCGHLDSEMLGATNDSIRLISEEIFTQEGFLQRLNEKLGNVAKEAASKKFFLNQDTRAVTKFLGMLDSIKKTFEEIIGRSKESISETRPSVDPKDPSEVLRNITAMSISLRDQLAGKNLADGERTAILANIDEIQSIFSQIQHVLKPSTEVILQGPGPSSSSLPIPPPPPATPAVRPSGIQSLLGAIRKSSVLDLKKAETTEKPSGLQLDPMAQALSDRLGEIRPGMASSSSDDDSGDW